LFLFTEGERIQLHKMVFNQYAHGLLKAYILV
jgi:hypothetical protein